MSVDRNLLAACGLYCGVCAVYQATRDNNAKLKEVLLGVYKGRLPNSDNLTAEEITCRGCHSGQTWAHCANCEIRSCALARNLDGCHQCQDWPCQLIQEFPMAIAKKVIMRSIPQRREVGDDQWAAAEEARYRCPACDQRLTRGAPRCHACGRQVDLD